MILRGWRNLCKQGSNQNQICFFFFNHECSILWASVAVVGKITSQHPRWLLSAQRLGWHANVAHMQVLEQHFLGRVCLFLKCQTTFCLCYCSMICNERGTLCNPCLSASPLKIFTFRATASVPFSSQMPSECFLKEEVMQHSGKHASGWDM